MTELILGTAQLGEAYGITNSAGRLADAEVSAVIQAAETEGIVLFDTSPGYGDAQVRLGELDRSSATRYISKFALPDEPARVDAEGLYGRTLRELRRPALEGLLFHRTGDLRDPRADQAWGLLREARAEGRVRLIGASIYDADDLVVAADRFPDLDLLQIPGNVIDRRLLDHPLIGRLHDRGVSIHVRSAYLQGLLLSEPERIPVHLAALGPVVRSLRDVAAEKGISVIALVLAFLRRHPVVDAVLVGAASPAELHATAAAWSEAEGLQIDLAAPELSDDLVDPRAWSRLASA